MTPDYRWRKSTCSNSEGACVEVAHTLTAVRDSKNTESAALDVEVRGLLTAVKTGQFDR